MVYLFALLPFMQERTECYPVALYWREQCQQCGKILLCRSHGACHNGLTARRAERSARYESVPANGVARCSDGEREVCLLLYHRRHRQVTARHSHYDSVRIIHHTFQFRAPGASGASYNPAVDKVSGGVVCCHNMVVAIECVVVGVVAQPVHECHRDAVAEPDCAALVPEDIAHLHAVARQQGGDERRVAADGRRVSRSVDVRVEYTDVESLILIYYEMLPELLEPRTPFCLRAGASGNIAAQTAINAFIITLIYSLILYVFRMLNAECTCM